MQPANIETNTDITLFVPCYNEEKNILGTLHTIVSSLKETNYTYDLVIIDDASSDKSVEVIQKYQQQHPEILINLIVNDKNKGLSYNFVEGSFVGKGKYYRQVNGDNDEPIETLKKVFQNIGKADMIITYHEKNVNRSITRKLISKIFTLLINIITGHSIKYYNGLTIYHRINVMRWHSRFQGFGYQADLTSRLLDLGFSYIQIPVNVCDRRAGESKALTLNNLLSVNHVFLELFIRRIKKMVYRGKTHTLKTSAIK